MLPLVQRKDRGRGTRFGFGHNEMSRKPLNVNVSRHEYTGLEKFRGRERERAEVIHLEVFQHREGSQSQGHV